MTKKIYSVEIDTSAYAYEIFHCEKSWKVDEKQRVVPIIVYSEVTA